MNSIVCIKQVPDTSEVRINPETGTLIREGVPSIINPDDRYALEAALTLKDTTDGTVTVITMGPPQATAVLREALAMGADRAFLVTDRAFGGSDTWATATILAAAIETIGAFDVVFCGRQAIDGDTAQVGPELAEFLGLPQVTYVKDIQAEGQVLHLTRYTDYGDYEMSVPVPALLTVISDYHAPRYPTVSGIIHAFDNDAPIANLTLADLAVDTTQIGLKGSPTNVYKSFVPQREKNSEILDGETAQAKTDRLVERLRGRNLI